MIPRRLTALAAAAALLFGVGVAAAVTHDDEDTSSEQAVVTSTTPTTTTTIPADTTTTSVEADTTTTTTTARGATTTTARAARTTTRPPGSTTTSTTRPTGDCTASQIEVTARTDRASYGVDQQVIVDSTLRNKSSAPCFYAGHIFQVTILDTASRSIITFDIVTPGPTRTQFLPTATLSGSVPWDQRSCQTQPCPQPPPGTYTAACKWTFAGGPYETRATFTLTN